jgi:Ni,Fe-hydrogenase I cytochrome b subunit
VTPLLGIKQDIAPVPTPRLTNPGSPKPTHLLLGFLLVANLLVQTWTYVTNKSVKKASAVSLEEEEFLNNVPQVIYFLVKKKFLKIKED